LSQDKLLRLLAARDQRGATRFGLVWKAKGNDCNQALNHDSVTLDLAPNTKP